MSNLGTKADLDMVGAIGTDGDGRIPGYLAGMFMCQREMEVRHKGIVT